MVLYRLHPFSYWIFRNVLRYDISFISPVNLVTEQLTVPELLQEQATPEQVTTATLALLEPQGRQQVLDGYEHLRTLLGEIGSVDRAAMRMMTYLKNEASASAMSE